MTDDRNEELERIQNELLADDDLLADMPASLLQGSDDEQPSGEAPAFDDPDQINEPEGPMVYCNYSNGYGQNPEPEESQYTENRGKRQEPIFLKKKDAKTKREDNIQIILMAIASFLCLGIIGVMIYWLEVFLK